MVFHWSLSDSKSLQVFMSIFSILADLKDAVFWIFSTYSLISKSSSPFTKPSRIVQTHQLQLVSPSFLLFLSKYLLFWLLYMYNCVYICRRVDWKVHKLTKIPSWNVTEWDLFFHIVLLAVHTLLPSALHYMDPIDQKLINSRYEVII